MTPTALARTWAEGGAATGLWCALGDTAVLELAARAGFDYVTVDLQHGLNTWHSLPLTLRVLRATGTTVLVRVQTADPVQVTRALDLGADGVVVPMVEDAATVAAVVAACRYPSTRPGAPFGDRSYGPVWADHDGVGDPEESSERAVCVVQLETAKAVANLEEIVAVPGLHAAYVGPYDLALSHGRGGETYRDSPVMAELAERVVTAADRAGIVGGMHCDGPEMVAHWRRRGARMLTASLDTAVVRTAYQTLAREAAEAAAL
jgi:4-hydroxy-2-oxoheptanedioate aldolase